MSAHIWHLQVQQQKLLICKIWITLPSHLHKTSENLPRRHQEGRGALLAILRKLWRENTPTIIKLFLRQSRPLQCFCTIKPLGDHCRIIWLRTTFSAKQPLTRLSLAVKIIQMCQIWGVFLEWYDPDLPWRQVTLTQTPRLLWIFTAKVPLLQTLKPTITITTILPIIRAMLQ